MTKETKDLGAAPPHAPPEVDPHEGPTEQQCSNHECVAYNEEVGYAIWYPQMGGYVGKAIVFDGGSQPSGCFEAVVWHDGEFPFGDGEPVSIHHCDAEQFVRFGTTVERLLFGNAAEPPPDSSAALLEARRLLREIGDRIDCLCEYKCDSRTKYHTPICVRGRLEAFLRSDSERSEPARSESWGSKVVHDPTEEER